VRYINLLINTINRLRTKGLVHHASTLDGFLHKNAQELGGLGDVDALEQELAGDAARGGDEPSVPAAPPETEKPAPKEQAKLQHALYYQFEKWHSVLDRELPKFRYLGEQNIDAIRSAFAKTHKTFQQAMQAEPMQYDKAALQKWNEQIDKIAQQMKKSQSAPVSRTKAITDAHLLSDTTNNLHDQFERLCGEDEKFKAVGAEFSNLIHTLDNVIKNTSEEIAKQDLTQVR